MSRTARGEASSEFITRSFIDLAGNY